MRGRVEIEAADRTMIVTIGPHAAGLGAVVLAEELAGGPLILLPQDVVVKVLEELELDRFGEPFGGLDAVHHDTPHPPDEVPVKEADRVPQGPCKLRLPFVPGIGLEVAASHAAAPNRRTGGSSQRSPG